MKIYLKIWLWATCVGLLLFSSTSVCADIEKPANLKEFYFTPGETLETVAIEIGFPIDEFHPELTRWDWVDLPVKRVRTVGGDLITYGESHPPSVLWLNDKRWIRVDTVWFVQAHKEEQDKVAIMVITLDGYGDKKAPLKDGLYVWQPHVIDMGVSPPFISNDYLTIENIEIEKLADGVYTFSGDSFIKGAIEKTSEYGGRSWLEIDKSKPRIRETYKYDRKTRSLIKLEPETNKD